jgi:hypothetical protein
MLAILPTGRVDIETRRSPDAMTTLAGDDSRSGFYADEGKLGGGRWCIEKSQAKKSPATE